MIVHACICMVHDITMCMQSYEAMLMGGWGSIFKSKSVGDRGQPNARFLSNKKLSHGSPR